MTEVLAPTSTDQQLVAEDISNTRESADGAVSVVPSVQVEKEPEHVQRGIYFVRVPRPALADNESINKLETELSACFTKLKAINNKFQVKKGEANELRKQLSLARSLRNGSSPEFDEKMTRLKQLREMRKGYLDKIQDYKSGRAGLECRTEEELDEKIAEMEHSIQHDGLTLTAEKQMVKSISKLKSQREKIREFQGAQDGLAQMEAEAKKLKAVIDEIDGEVNILRGEREQAKDIIEDLSKKLNAVNAVIDGYQEERQEIEETKKKVQDQLKVLREENDEAMFEFRANRKLGVQLRDLVAEGKVEEAQKLAAEQVETYLGKFSTDKAYKQDYLKLWSEQRRYAVSELLPESGNVEQAPAAAGKGGKGGKGAAGKPAAPLVPQGKAKAEALIAAALQEAGASLAAKRLAEPQQHQPEPEPSEEEVEEEADSKPAEPPARRVVPGASDDLIAVRKTKAPKAAAKHVTELPVIPNYEYELPVESSKGKQGQQLSADELKAQVREEQRQKAAEAEERKKRRQEQQAKKAAARLKAAEEAAAAAKVAAKAANRAAALAAAIAVEAENAGSGTDGDERDDVLESAAAGETAAATSSSGGRSRGGKGKGHHKGKQHHMPAPPVAKPIKKPPKPQKWHEQYSTEIVCVVVAIITLILAYLGITSR